jgi:hypothetical protein
MGIFSVGEDSSGVGITQPSSSRIFGAHFLAAATRGTFVGCGGRLIGKEFAACVAQQMASVLSDIQPSLNTGVYGKWYGGTRKGPI